MQSQQSGAAAAKAAAVRNGTRLTEKGGKKQQQQQNQLRAADSPETNKNKTQRIITRTQTDTQTDSQHFECRWRDSNSHPRRRPLRFLSPSQPITFRRARACVHKAPGHNSAC